MDESPREKMRRAAREAMEAKQRDEAAKQEANAKERAVMEEQQQRAREMGEHFKTGASEMLEDVHAYELKNIGKMNLALTVFVAGFRLGIGKPQSREERAIEAHWEQSVGWQVLQITAARGRSRPATYETDELLKDARDKLLEPVIEEAVRRLTYGAENP